ncbi:DUF4007 family protein [Selenihalanaerobacter shriftii]|uniref:DUF4007 domain-containing protein n=1 Tax=Selenihalanaerobacter shriftii TaxID=142842 RepID=A0A1T4NEX2_9FIRM|nr:DUF4007 family protein [Selenihalanaerobacter shriftii]SJZ77675.1 Protein of unknown function [Selenihalanaerobacter shriftii]
MSYSFARHETFHIRTGWLRKGLKAIEKNNHIFLETIPAMDELGIGKNMISSLRYWLQVTGLTEEDYDSNRQKIQEKKELTGIVLNYDEYFEDPSTFWLLHFNLCRNKEVATTWYWFFNHFNYLEFDKELFVEELINYIRRTGEEPPAKSSLEKDFNTFKRMYLYDPEDNNSPEDSLQSPFSELKLITKVDTDTYAVNRPSIDTLPPRILFYSLLLSLEAGTKSVNVEEVLNQENSIGRLFKLNISLLYEYLEKLQEIGYLHLDKHAGLNSIQLRELSQDKVLEDYYGIKK